jgi:hypothetical protein
MSSQTLSSEKVYRLPHYVMMILLIFPFLGFAGIGFGLLTFLPSLNESIADSIGITIVGILFCLAMTGMYLTIKRTRLVLTEDGATYYAWGFRIYTPWQNVIGIGSTQPYSTFPLNVRTFWGLQLRQYSMLGMKLADGKRQGKAALETDWWNPASTMAPFASILPMTPMLPGRNWKESPLGAACRYTSLTFCQAPTLTS